MPPRTLGSLLALALAGGCYHGAAASRDISEAWRGRPRGALEARWGPPAGQLPDAGRTFLRWTRLRRDVTLPGAAGALTVERGRVEGWVEVHAGTITMTPIDVIAAIDGDGRVAEIRGPSVERSAPDDVNLHWGVIYGLHVGMGRLDVTGTPLPSGGAYLGGMLTPRFGLVGCYALVTGTSDAGSAMGMAWAMAAQWWPANRWSVRAGPALILALDPGLVDARLRPGADVSGSFAAVKVGAFTVDLRADVVAGPGTAFGSLGIGVNVN